MGIRQNHLTAHLRRLIGDKVAEARRKGLKMPMFPAGPETNTAENALFQLEQRGLAVSSQAEMLWAEALLFPPNPRIDDLAARPKILVTARGAKDLDKQLDGLHGNRPLVVIGLNDPADASAYADTCNALLNGPFPVGHGGETVTGYLLVTDPGCGTGPDRASGWRQIQLARTDGLAGRWHWRSRCYGEPFQPGKLTMNPTPPTGQVRL